jgi:hypothetical protein
MCAVGPAGAECDCAAQQNSGVIVILLTWSSDGSRLPQRSSDLFGLPDVAIILRC